MGDIASSDIIELTVPIYQIEEHINGLFNEGSFLAEYQSLEIVEFTYNEGEEVFHFTLKVISKEIN